MTTPPVERKPDRHQSGREQQQAGDPGKFNPLRFAWRILLYVTRHVRASDFLLVLTGIVAVAFIAFFFFGKNWQYVLLAEVIAILLAIPIILIIEVRKHAGETAFKIIGYTTFVGYAGTSFCVIGLVITTAVWQKPRPIEDILHLPPVRTNTIVTFVDRFITNSVVTTNFVNRSNQETLAFQVPVRASIGDTLTSGKTGPGMVEIPPGKQIRFVRAQPVRWSNDPYESISAYIGFAPFVWDLSSYHKKLVDFGLDSHAFKTNYLKNVFDELVKKGYASDRESGERALIEAAVNLYLDWELIPLLTNSQYSLPGNQTRRLGDGNHLAIIDCRDRGSVFSSFIARGRALVWKRIVAAEIVESGDVGKLLGPYFDVAAEGSTPPVTRDRPFPAPQERRGCLVGGLYRLENGTYTEIRSPSAFYLETHALENKTSTPLWAVFGMNDDIPEDNGWGYANVTALLESIDH